MATTSGLPTQNPQRAPGHAVGFGEGIELHSHLFGAGVGEKAAAGLAVKHELGIGVIVEDDDVVSFGKLDELGIKRGGRCYGGGVVGIGDHHQFGALSHGGGDFVQVDDIAVFRALGHIVNLGAGQARAVCKDGVAGVRHKDGIAGIHDGKGDMGQAFLRAQKGENFGIGIQRNVIAALIPIGNGAAQGLCIREGIEVIFRVKGALAQRLHDMRGGRDIRRADGQIHHGQPLRKAPGAGFGQLVEDADGKGIHTFGKLQSRSLPKESM